MVVPVTETMAPWQLRPQDVTETALYFPYMQVPQNLWFTKVLLYWDRAASIVPEPLHKSRTELNTYMRELVDEELLTLVRPDSVLERMDVEKFNEAFLEHLITESVAGRRAGYTRIHAGKMSYSLFRELCNRGLARDMEGSVTWWSVKSNIADLYMSYLASVISARTPGMFPVADQADYLKGLAPMAPTIPPDSQQQLQTMRYTVIKDILPAPQGEVPAAELRRFKDENADLLKECRNFLDSELAAMASVTDPVLLKAREIGFRQKIDREVTELKEQMARRKWLTISVTISCLVAVSVAVTDQLSGGSLGPLPLGAVVAASAWPAVKDVAELHEKAKKPRFDATAPMAYAAMASRLPNRTRR